MEIHEVIAQATAGALPEHRPSVEAAATGLLIPLGVQGVHDRVRLRVSGDRLKALHELLVDGDVVWVGAVERDGWRAMWIVEPWSLV